MLILKHTLLEVGTDLFKSIDITVFAGGKLARQLFHALLAGDLLGQSLDLAFDVCLKDLTKFFFVSGST